MKTHSNSNNIYLGTKAGEELLEDIKNAKKSVKIVSPYLKPKYARELVKLKEKGVDVTLIISDELEENDNLDFRHTDVIKQKKYTDEEKKEKREEGMRTSLLGGLLNIIPIILYLIIKFNFWILLFSIAIISFIVWGRYTKFKDMRIYTYSYESLFDLKVIYSTYSKERKGKELIHSKIYIIDESIAYLGSVNFTNAGMVYNYESSIKVKDQNAVRDISKEVDNLFNSEAVVYKDIQEWGRELYDEPRS